MERGKPWVSETRHAGSTIRPVATTTLVVSTLYQHPIILLCKAGVHNLSIYP